MDAGENRIIIKASLFQSIFKGNTMCGVVFLWIVPGMDLSGTPTKYTLSYVADCNISEKLSNVRSCETA